MALTHEVEFSHIRRSPEVDDCCNTIHFCTKHQIYVQGMKNREAALGGMAQWSEYQPENQRVTGSIPSQGTCLGCGPDPQKGARERQPPIDVSLPLFLLPFPSPKLKKIKSLERVTCPRLAAGIRARCGGHVSLPDLAVRLLGSEPPQFA